MIEKEKCRHIGVVSKAHGVEGEVNIKLLNNVEADDVNPEFFFLELDGALVPFYVMSIRDRGDGSLLVGFEDVDNEPAARRLLDVKVWIDDADYAPLMAEDGMVHSTMLIGFKVEDTLHGVLGVIVELRDPERNPLFVIEGAAGEILIPVADEFMTGLDADKKVLYITTPDGLIDLNRAE
jgi:16S rRNA processing protein RimM